MSRDIFTINIFFLWLIWLYLFGIIKINIIYVYLVEIDIILLFEKQKLLFWTIAVVF